MTPELRDAIELLRESRIELERTVHQELAPGFGESLAAQLLPLDLTTLLVLGAPDDKTELIDGAVQRMVVLKSPEIAQMMFVRLAREICLRFEKAPAKNIEPPLFECGRFKLELAEPHKIVLYVQSSMEEWKAFYGWS